ncbi:hypothetical protein B0T25DRAFT_523400 [Lasiosphaeria hispida]|uniref:Uncharacterized protein n=1 Tax=Lasiosphaeria hispida TaxID=260671 RepID=A0AAJ0H4V5_9PEZI|nr:hypothetical protein B0T25DRAFT_523400 [Lasiosphaeria hispida]
MWQCSLVSARYYPVIAAMEILVIGDAVEVNLAIIYAYLTTLKPLLVRVFPQALGPTHATTYTFGSSAISRAGGMVNVERSQATTTVKEEGRFTRLEDQSDQSANVPLPRPHTRWGAARNRYRTRCM